MDRPGPSQRFGPHPKPNLGKQLASEDEELFEIRVFTEPISLAVLFDLHFGQAGLSLCIILKKNFSNFWPQSLHLKE